MLFFIIMSAIDVRNIINVFIIPDMMNIWHSRFGVKFPSSSLRVLDNDLAHYARRYHKRCGPSAVGVAKTRRDSLRKLCSWWERTQGISLISLPDPSADSQPVCGITEKTQTRWTSQIKIEWKPKHPASAQQWHRKLRTLSYGSSCMRELIEKRSFVMIRLHSKVNKWIEYVYK